MQRLLFPLLAYLLGTNALAAAAVPKEAALIAMLKANPVVHAAVAQAQSFSGAKTCDYTVQQLTALTQFKAGSAYTYQVEINCITNGEAGIVRVEGAWLLSTGDYQDIEKLSLHFAG